MSRSPHETGNLAWPAALAAVAIIGTLATACMMPWVAIATITALTAGRGSAMLTIGGIWAVNQVIGFGLLGFPVDAYAISWGVALAGATMVAMFVSALLLDGRRTVGLRLGIAFAGAFVAFELLLFAFALVRGGTDTFTPEIVGQLFANDSLWFAGLLGLRLMLTRAAPQLFGPALSLRAA